MDLGTDQQRQLIGFLADLAELRYPGSLKAGSGSPADDIEFSLVYDGGLGLVWADPAQGQQPWWLRLTAGVATEIPAARHNDVLHWVNARNLALNSGTYLCLVHRETGEISVIFSSNQMGTMFSFDSEAVRNWFAGQLFTIAETSGPDGRACVTQFGGRPFQPTEGGLLLALSLAH
ncbi:hypothetical protein ACFWWC_25355 [Streptomyces sp. NPDC058642]|uniref:hypothetical protein n=1 Tax=Streptomyces sp. NPDC058642 TaxID=3346572 RepID=UPI0036511911